MEGVLDYCLNDLSSLISSKIQANKVARASQKGLTLECLVMLRLISLTGQDIAVMLSRLLPRSAQSSLAHLSGYRLDIDFAVHDASLAQMSADASHAAWSSASRASASSSTDAYAIHADVSANQSDAASEVSTAISMDSASASSMRSSESAPFQCDWLR
jgi:hypothetical protein